MDVARGSDGKVYKRGWSPSGHFTEYALERWRTALEVASSEVYTIVVAI